MKIFDKQKHMYRRARPISFEHTNEGQRALKIQLRDPAKAKSQWISKDAIWDDELKIWSTNN